MRIIKKILNSSYKRVNTFFGSGFSVERSYGLKWLIDWSNRVDKKMTFKLFEDDQISYFINNYKNDCNNIGMLSSSQITSTILFLLSDESFAINGQNLIIDDGWSL